MAGSFQKDLEVPRDGYKRRRARNGVSHHKSTTLLKLPATMLLLRSPFTSSDSNSLDHWFDELTRGTLQLPYWRDADHNSFNFSDTVGEVVNDASKFALQLDVSHFKPENLKIEINGRELKIEGEQETKSEHGYSKRTFSRMVLLPEDVDLTALKSAISNDGKLQIKAPKSTNTSRSIPINFVKNHQ